MKKLHIIYKLLAQITYLRKRLIIKKCNDYLGIDFTPLDIIPDEVGCAEAVTTILKECGTLDQVIAGTWTLNDHLQKSKYWLPTPQPQAGDIIISPTGSVKNAPFRGHVGIVGNNGIVYANNSWTGKWSTNYTLDTWKEHYHKAGGYPVYYYTYITAL